MPRLHLVRHAEAAAGWGDDRDPGLSEAGMAQAEAMAEVLGPQGPLPLFTSPLRRARETAAVLEQRWGISAVVETGVGEVPSPSDDLAERQVWLRDALAGTWSDLGPRYRSWRTMVLGLLEGLVHDSVVVTHFVLINAVLGAARDDDRLVVERIPNAGVTVVDVDHGRFEVVQVPSGGDTGPVL